MKEVTVELRNKVEKWTSSILSPNTIVKMLDRRPYGRRGMIEHVEVCTSEPIREVIRTIRAVPNIAFSTFTVLDKHRATGIVITKESPVCRAVSSQVGFCRDCVIAARTDANEPSKWQVIFSGKIPLKNFLAQLNREGIDAIVTESGPSKENRSLTFLQERVIELAQREGYFRFPRRTSLKKLSKKLKISPSTLDEILRRAEGKIVADYVGNPRAGSDGLKG